jgi:PilZ domain
MLESSPSPGGERPAPAHAERRAYVRVPSSLAAQCRPARRLDVSWPGRVQDISRGGVGLLLRHCFRAGTYLDVELCGRGGAVLRTIAVRVVHARAAVVDGERCWLLGCAFEEPLSEEELRGLL